MSNSNQLNNFDGAGSGFVYAKPTKTETNSAIRMHDICVLYMAHWIIFNTCHIDRCDNSRLWAKYDCNQHKKRPSTQRNEWHRCQSILHSTYRLNAGQKVLWYIYSRSFHAISLYFISFELKVNRSNINFIAKRNYNFHINKNIWMENSIVNHNEKPTHWHISQTALRSSPSHIPSRYPRCYCSVYRSNLPLSGLQVNSRSADPQKLSFNCFHKVSGEFDLFSTIIKRLIAFCLRLAFPAAAFSAQTATIFAWFFLLSIVNQPENQTTPQQKQKIVRLLVWRLDENFPNSGIIISQMADGSLLFASAITIRIVGG